MANGFLRALAKVKLVELEEEPATSRSPSDKSASSSDKLAEVDAMLKEPSRPAPKAPAPPPRPPVRTEPSFGAAASGQARAVAQALPGIAENTPFDDYYAAAGVAAATYPAEKLVRVLDGLRAMDSATRRAAILAMDAADDAWTIADVVLDAGYKVSALETSVRGIEERVTQAIAHAQQEKATRDAYLQQATETIRKKIAELEQTLQNEVADIAAQKAHIDAASSEATVSGAREIERLRSEATKLREIEAIFGTTT